LLVSNIDHGIAETEITNSVSDGEPIHNHSATTINGENPAIIDAEIKEVLVALFTDYTQIRKHLNSVMRCQMCSSSGIKWPEFLGF
jgi:hypothetical protein